MIDYFSYNGGKGVLPIYSPGIPAYGQKGAPGNTGAAGSSILFCAYNLSNETEKTEAIAKILNNQSLSNNSNYPKANEYREYSIGDIILDTAGKFYEITNTTDITAGDGTIDLVPASVSNLSSQTAPKVKNFSVTAITSFKNNDEISSESKLSLDDFFNLFYENKTAEMQAALKDASDENITSWKYPNPYYVKVKNANKEKSPYWRHKDYYSKYAYGNHLEFVLDFGEETPPVYTYKYYLEFPNGEILTQYDNSPKHRMFVDNKYCYACSGFADYYIPLSSDVTAISAGIPANPSDPSKSETVKNIIENPLYGEESIAIAILASRYMQEYCKAYVDIMDNSGNTTYRIDLDDIFFKEDGTIINVVNNQITAPGQRPNEVVPARIKTGWSVYTYTAENTTVDSSTDYVHKASKNAWAPDPIANNVVQFCYDFPQFNEFNFVEKSMPIAKDPNNKAYEIKFIKDSSTWINSYKDHTGKKFKTRIKGSDILYNKVLRLYFTQVTSVTLLVQYNKIGNTDEYPSTVTYIGRPNIPLMQTDSSSYSTLYPRGTKVPGIYYLNKIVPNTYTDTTDEYTTVLSANYAEVKIDTAAFDNIESADATNFIEIGFVSMDSSSNKHCETSPKDVDVTIFVYELDDNIPIIEHVNDPSAEDLFIKGGVVFAKKHNHEEAPICSSTN